MRICLVNTFHYRRGGDSTYTLELGELLRERGHEVIEFAMKHPMNIACKYEGYFVDHIDYKEIYTSGNMLSRLKALLRSLYSVEARKRFERLIDDTRPEVIHLQNIRRHLTFSILNPALKVGLPVVLTAHDYDPICPNSLLFTGSAICEACRGKHFYRAILKRCKEGSIAGSLAIATEGYFVRFLGYYRRLSLIITPSQFLRKKLIAYGFSPQKVICIPNFMDSTLYQPRYEPGDYIVYAGRLYPEKGVEVLIRAASRLPKLSFVVAGTGPLERGLRQLAIRLGAENVNFVGHLDKDTLRQTLSNAMFAVIPSIWYENLPYAILEPFACGKPVIGSRLGGIPEVVKDGITGFLVEAGDDVDLAERIAYLSERPGLIQELGRNARKKVEDEFNADLHLDRLTSAYSKLLR